MPYAHLASGNADKAIAALEAVLNAPKAAEPAASEGATAEASAGRRAINPNQGLGQAQLLLGDIHAASGNFDKAIACYEDAGKRDKSVERYVTLRTALTGKPAPNIDSKTWLGAEANSLAGLKGKVVLVDFWATWAARCRIAIRN